MITTTQVLLGFVAILTALFSVALFTLIGWVRGDLAELKRTVDEMKADTDLIPGLAARLDRLEIDGRTR